MDFLPVYIGLLVGGIIVYYYVKNTDESKFEELQKTKNKPSKTIKSLTIVGKLFISVLPITVFSASLYGFFMVEEPKYFFLILMFVGGLGWLYKIWFKNELF